jgi:hypothetical protein
MRNTLSLSIATSFVPSACKRVFAPYLSFQTLTGVVCLLTLCSGAQHGARAEPRFATNATHAALWRKVYDRMPAVWKTKRVILVRELTEWQMDRLVADAGGDTDSRHRDTVVDGCYQDNDLNKDQNNDGNNDQSVIGEGDIFATISLSNTLQGDQAALIFAHEYGHYVWEDRLTLGQRADYRRLWRSQRRTHHLVSDYAADSVEEGFAEAFAHFLRKPALLRRRDARSAAFLDQLLAASRHKVDAPADDLSSL